MGARSRLQRDKRVQYTQMVCKKVIRRLEKLDMTTMHSTNRLVPPGSLKRAEVRFLFSGWVRKLKGEGRIVTLKLAQHVCMNVRDYFGLPPLEDDHAKAEFRRFHRLLKEARKRGLASRKPMAMDNAETLPMHVANEDL